MGAGFLLEKGGLLKVSITLCLPIMASEADS